MMQKPNSLLSWSFKENDWLVEYIFNNKNILFKILTLKDYQTNKIDEIVLNIINNIKPIREKLENSSESFKKKKEYLNNKNNKNIQISLNDEYTLKNLIEMYKIYEFIGWIHLGKNIKILKYCINKKKNILENIYPIVYLSIRKVIGSKVIDPYLEEFEEAVNNAWLSIIKYLNKIDTSKVMFSIFLGISHRSAIYYNAIRLRYNYNTVRLSELENKTNDESELFDDETFIKNVSDSNESFDNDHYEDYILDEIDAENITYDYISSIVNKDLINEEQIDKYIDEIDGSMGITSKFNQNLLTYCFNNTSGKIKKLCFNKIFSYFFIDLLNNNIDEKIIKKHSTSILNTFNNNISEEELLNINENIYIMLKDWVKNKYNNMQNKDKYITNEKNILNYMKNNKQNIYTSLKKFIEDSNNVFSN